MMLEASCCGWPRFPHPAQDFLDNYLSHEIDRTGSTRSQAAGQGWKDFAKKKSNEIEKIREEIKASRPRRRAIFEYRRMVKTVRTAKREICRQRRNDRGQPALVIRSPRNTQPRLHSSPHPGSNIRL